MISAILDTDTVIALLRGNERLRHQAQLQPVQSLAISMVTLYELHVGVEKSRALEDTMSPFLLLPFDQAASLAAARVRATLEKKGRGIGPYDTLIAGQALALGVPLVTANTREFSRVPELKLANWLK